MLKEYYILTKPGIVRGNAIHTLAGAFLASIWMPNWIAVTGVLVGTSFVIASACVVNNYLDRKMDRKMERTNKRASATGNISLRNGIVYAIVLLLLGFILLTNLTNMKVVVIGMLAYILYAFVYTLSKPRTVHSTLIGAIPGALPAMAGYVAVTNDLEIGAWLVFLLVAIWQMPHFYAISVFRKQQYKAAGVPVLGVVKPFKTVKKYILVYLIAYALVVTTMIYFQVVEPLVGVLLLAGAAYWLYVFRFYKSTPEKWSRAIFGVSLLLSLLLLIAAVVQMFVTS